MTMTTRLLIIDPQQDFCDGPVPGALAVPGADADMTRLADLIARLGAELGTVDVTMDSHRSMDIAHPGWWVSSDGKTPEPFTIISEADIVSGRWKTRNPVAQKRSLEYVRALEQKGKYALMLWPPHCLVGSAGHAVHAGLHQALTEWELTTLRTVTYLPKGLNPFTEHYSAVAAEVPDPQDPATRLNQSFLETLISSDRILVAGEALSHCVRATVTDIAEAVGAEQCRKFVLLADCMSPVPAVPGGPDFPALGQAFLRDMRDRGMTVTDSRSL